MPWKQHTPGCPCCVPPPPPPCDIEVEIIVGGCSLFRLEGVGVRFKDGATVIDSGVTDASGVVVLTVSPATLPKSYTLEIDAVGTLPGKSLTFQFFNCYPRSYYTTPGDVPADHVCTFCCEGFPVSRTLDLSTPMGDCVMTYFPRSASIENSQGKRWVGELTVSVQQLTYEVLDCCADPPDPNVPLPGDCVATDQTYTLDPYAYYSTTTTVSTTFYFRADCLPPSGYLPERWVLWFGIGYRGACGPGADCLSCNGDYVYGVYPWDTGLPPGAESQTGDAEYGIGLGGGYGMTGGLAMTGTCAEGTLALSGTMPGPGGDFEVEGHVGYEDCCRQDGQPLSESGFVTPANPFQGTFALNSP